MVVSARHSVHSVLFLILCFFNAAILFIFLGAELVSLVMMIVYVGAVAVLFLFVVMMLDMHQEGRSVSFARTLPVAGLIGAVLLSELAVVFLHWKNQWFEGEGGNEELTISEALTNSESIGLVLYTKYAFLLEICGLILLVAMVGAIVLTLRKNPKGGDRRVDVSAQIKRRREDVIEIKKIPSSEKLS
jgi:NADH-quinone oxidoreductase subunit J